MFPAWAGVILDKVMVGVNAISVPRMGGGDPTKALLRMSADGVFPAWAGVILPKQPHAQLQWGVPRMGGGDPYPQCSWTKDV